MPSTGTVPPSQSYKSPYGPSYKVPPSFHGITLRTATKFGIAAGSFGVAAGIFGLFFLEGVPRVRRDILQKLPIIGDYWIREIPPSDNPF